MKKRKNLSIFILLFLSVAVIIFACGGGGGSNGGGGGEFNCAGPVPCLNQDWVGIVYKFQEPGNIIPIFVTSDGDAYAVAWLTNNLEILAIGGYVSDCYNGDIQEGAKDYYPPDGVIDYWFNSVSGNVNICDIVLTISDLIIEGTSEADIIAIYNGVADVAATYNGVTTSLKSNKDQTDRKIPPGILFEILDKISNEQ